MSDPGAAATGLGSVAILGCGWLGRALAQNLLAAGYQVLGSTTSPEKVAELQALGIEAYRIQLPSANREIEDQNGESPDAALPFWQADQLVIAFPPGSRSDSAFAKTYPGAVLSAILAYRRAQSSGRIIFCSSTGIYGNAEGLVTIETPIMDASPRVQALALAESQIRAQSQRPNVILRLAGLYGPGRHPGRFLAGRQDLADGDAPVNLASQQRVIDRIRHYLDAPFWTAGLENVVDPEHPNRRDYYAAAAKTEGLEAPTFLPGGATGKLVM